MSRDPLEQVYPSDAGKLSAILQGKIWAFQGAVAIWAAVQLEQLELPLSPSSPTGTFTAVEDAGSDLVDCVFAYVNALRHIIPPKVSADD